MAQTVYNRFNRGVVDKLALTRLDVEKVTNTCEVMDNWLPIRLGPMNTAPGFDYLGPVKGPAIIIPFVRNIDETAVIELSDLCMRVWLNDEVITRADTSGISIDSVDLWKDASSGGGQTVSFPIVQDGSTGSNKPGFDPNTGEFFEEFEHVPPEIVPTTDPDPDTNTFPDTASNTNGGVTFTGVTAAGVGRRCAQVTGGVGRTFAVRFVIPRESVRVLIGLSGPESQEIFEGELDQGVHSLLIVNPEANPTITIESVGEHTSVVYFVEIEQDGPMTIPTAIREDTLDKVRYYQIADRIFISHPDGQSVIERRGANSWSMIDYQTTDGPWGFVNDTDITLRPTALTGDLDILANQPLFSQGDVGSLVRIASSSENADTTATIANVSTNSIRVDGEGTARDIRVNIAGAYTGQVVLERSVDNIAFTAVETFIGQDDGDEDDTTQNTSTTHTENFNDMATGGLFFYRLRSEPGFSGQARMLLSFAGGSIEGTARIVDFVSPTQVGARSIRPFGSTQPTPNWYQSSWSRSMGFPSAVTFEDGRLFWAGSDQVWGSESDEYFGFDRLREGDRQSILRTIGFGPVDDVLWLGVAEQLILGLTTDEITLRGSSFGEAVTQDNARLKSGTHCGAACVIPLAYDNRLYYPSRSGRMMMELIGSGDTHTLRDLTYLNQDIGRAGFIRTTMTKEPETRIYAVRSDGTMAIALMDKDEDVLGWSTRSFPFPARDVCALPSRTEDDVFALIETPNGWLMAKQGSLLDPHLHPIDLAAPVNDTDRLSGQVLDVWDGPKRLAMDVTGGGALPFPDTAMAGYRITAKYKSNRLGRYATDRQTDTDTERKRVTHLGLIMCNLLIDGFRMGRSFDDENLQKFTRRIGGVEPVRDEVILGELDVLKMPSHGHYDIDSRVHLVADGPATVALMDIVIDTPKDENRRRR